MQVSFPNYTPILSETDASDDAPVLPVEPVLFDTDSAGSSGGGGKREIKSEEEGLPGKAPSSTQPAAETDQNPEDAGEQPDAAADEPEENPGLQPKNKNYFKSDSTPDTGIGNV
jgi:hypothetical protein